LAVDLWAMANTDSGEPNLGLQLELGTGMITSAR